MVHAGIRSAVAIVALLLAAFAGESAAWHDHPIDTGELAASRISVVENGADCGPQEHVDRGHETLRSGCVACVHGSRPTAHAAPVALRTSLPARAVGRMAGAESLPTELVARLEPVRGPPASASPRTA